MLTLVILTTILFGSFTSLLEKALLGKSDKPEESGRPTLVKFTDEDEDGSQNESDECKTQYEEMVHPNMDQDKISDADTDSVKRDNNLKFKLQKKGRTCGYFF